MSRGMGKQIGGEEFVSKQEKSGEESEWRGRYEEEARGRKTRAAKVTFSGRDKHYYEFRKYGLYGAARRRGVWMAGEPRRLVARRRRAQTRARRSRERSISHRQPPTRRVESRTVRALHGDHVDDDEQHDDDDDDCGRSGVSLMSDASLLPASILFTVSSRKQRTAVQHESYEAPFPTSYRHPDPDRGTRPW